MSLLPNLGSIGSGVSNFYKGVATQSLRFDDGSSAFLSRTPAGASTNLKAFTFSTWVKRSSVSGATHTLFSAGANSNDVTMIRFEGNGITDTQLSFFNYTSGSLTTTLKTKAKFRDSSAWYNIIVACDTTQSGANKAKIYVNGVLVDDWHDSSHDEYPNDDSTFQFGNNVVHRLGSLAYSTTQLFDGYMAETNFVENTQLAPSVFGELKNGVWIPIAPSPTYGTNGFRLQFEDNAVGTPENEGVVEDDNIGRDSSGEHNHFTSSGLDAWDCAIPDSPEDNFCIMGSSSMRRYGHGNVATMAEGGLLATSAGNATHAFGTMSIKQILANGLGVYFEMRCVTDGTPRCYFGIVAGQENNVSAGGGDGTDAALYEYPLKFVIDVRGTIFAGTQTNGTAETNIGAGALSGDYSSIFTVAAGDVMGVAIKSDGKVFISKNGTFVNSLAGTSNPATGANPIHLIDTTLDWFPINGYSDSAWHANFGQDGSFSDTETSGGETDSNGIGDFFGAVPSGFVCLSTLNMAEPTIGANSLTIASDHFNSVLYTGDDNANRGITGVGFKPDFLWHKARNATNWHFLFDSNRGVDKRISSNEANAEGDATGLDSFDSDGFTVDHEASAQDMNASAHTYVAWNWKANGGTTSTIAVDSVSSGVPSIASAVQANTDAGFSIVTYSGNTDASATIGHGLGVVPKMIMVKKRDEAGNWIVFTETTGKDNKLNLNATTANATSALFNNADPTSTVFSVKDTSSDDTFGDGHTYVAYCFADVEGYSKFGSYTGNGVASGAFIYTGFRPAFVMMKRTDSTGSWFMLDKTRDVDNEVLQDLIADGSGAETSNSNFLDFLSNGFKLRTTGTAVNASGGTYIYMAFAESPFKYANAR